MFKTGWWIEYCICSGTVIGNIGNPYCGSEGKNLCEHTTCELTEIGNPFCSVVETQLCFTGQCSFPKLDDSPTCACCNKILAGNKTPSGWKPQLFDTTYEWGQQFWLYYFLCMGSSVHVPGADGRPLFAFVEKELCIKEACQCVGFVEEGAFCASVGTNLCFWDQCQCPPATNNPKFACCGMMCLNKGAGGNSGEARSPMAYGK
jgi:hypothetical protein